MIKIKLAEDSKDFFACFDALSELRPSLRRDCFEEQINEQLSWGYQVVLCETEEGVIAVAGFSVSFCFSAGVHLYLYDFVVKKPYRRGGIANQLMKWIVDYGKTKGATSIHLDASVSRQDALSFFRKYGFAVTAHHFSLPLTD